MGINPGSDPDPPSRCLCFWIGVLVCVWAASCAHLVIGL